jgi:hypothetical protein
MNYYKMTYTYDGFPHYGEGFGFKRARTAKEAENLLKSKSKTKITIIKTEEA